MGFKDYGDEGPMNLPDVDKVLDGMKPQPKSQSYYWCGICRKPIIGKDIEEMHTDPITGEDVHAAHCPKCNPL